MIAVMETLHWCFFGPMRRPIASWNIILWINLHFHYIITLTFPHKHKHLGAMIPHHHRKERLRHEPGITPIPRLKSNHIISMGGTTFWRCVCSCDSRRYIAILFSAQGGLITRHGKLMGDWASPPSLWPSIVAIHCHPPPHTHPLWYQIQGCQWRISWEKIFLPR